MKKCRKCGAERPIEDFYTSRRRPDGHLSQCKECIRLYARNYRQKSPSSREYDYRRYRNNPDRRRYINGNRSRDPFKARSREALRRAVRKGLVTKPTTCSVCGCVPRQLEGHHPDHLKPLEVIWCCTVCHRVLEGVTIPHSVAMSQRTEVPGDLPIIQTSPRS